MAEITVRRLDAAAPAGPRPPLAVANRGLAGIDGTVSTLAPVFAAALYAGPFAGFLVGIATALGAGISMGWSEALSDTERPMLSARTRCGCATAWSRWRWMPRILASSLIAASSCQSGSCPPISRIGSS